eukprot:Nk52_evm83s217 gene=Nk52_evmTU83s217
MSSSFVLLGPRNGQRTVVKATPMMKFAQILQTAGEKHGFSALQILSDYCLKHRGKEIDLSLTVRFANIPNNATLDVSERSGAGAEDVNKQTVKVVLQFSNGERSNAADISPSSSLWEILEQIEKQEGKAYSGSITCPDPASNFNCAGESGAGEGAGALVPRCVYMREMFEGLSTLCGTTLMDLGLFSGSVLLRVSHHRSAAMNLDQLREEVGNLKKERENVKKALKTTKESSVKTVQADAKKGGNASTGSSSSTSTQQTVNAPTEAPFSFPQPTSSIFDAGSSYAQQHHQAQRHLPPVSQSSTFGEPVPLQQQPDFTAFKFPEKPIGASSSVDRGNDSALSPSVADANPLEEVTIRVFDRTTVPTVTDAAFSASDDVYNVTERDVRIMLESAKSELQNMQDAPLMTAAMRKAKVVEKYGKYSVCKIKVLLPENVDLFLEMPVLNKNSASLYRCVRECLADKNAVFELYVSPPKRVIPCDAKVSLLEAGVVPAAALHVSFEGDCSGGLALEQNLLEKMEAYANVSIPTAAPVVGPSGSSTGSGETSMAVDRDAEREQLRQRRNQEASVRMESSSSSSGSKVPKWFKPGKK